MNGFGFKANHEMIKMPYNYCGGNFFSLPREKIFNFFSPVLEVNF